MKGTAHEITKLAISLIQNLSDGDTNGEAIDCLGFEEALLFVVHGVLGGSTDAISDVLWQECATLAGVYVAITGAAHTQVIMDPDLIVVSQDLTNAALTVVASVPVNPSHLVFVVVDTTSSITTGTFYVVGTDRNDAAQTEIVTITQAGTYYTTKVFKTVTSITAGVVSDITGTIDIATLGGSSDETVTVGAMNADHDIVREGRLDLKLRERYIRAVVDASGTTPTGEICAGAVLMAARVKPTVRDETIDFSV